MKKALAFLLLCAVSGASFGQVTPEAERNTSKRTNDDNECSVAINPTNKDQIFVASNVVGVTGLFCARSVDGGLTWTYPDPSDKTLADGDAGQGASACCDPSLTWDAFGNLYLTYINSSVNQIVTLRSTDGGATFTTLASFGPASVDQPTIVSAKTTAPGAPVAVWVVWNQGGSMVARGAAVTGLGAATSFNALQTIPGTSGSSFGDIAIAPNGAVVQVSQSPTGGQGPSTILCNIDADGLGPNNFGAAISVTQTNVGGFDFIPAQNSRSVDAEAGLAFDANPASPHYGRLYLVYTDETVNENNDLDIIVRFSDNTGQTWSTPIRVNDDTTTRSQFMPKIASNPLSGNIAICWHDCRNSATNRAAELYMTVATPQGATPTFFANVKVSGGASTSNGLGVEFGDYLGLAYYGGRIMPAWADTSNFTGDNPNGTSRFDINTNRSNGGAAANERAIWMDQIGTGAQGLTPNILISLKDPAAGFERRVYDDFNITAATNLRSVEFAPRCLNGFGAGQPWQQIVWHVGIYKNDGTNGGPGTTVYEQTGVGTNVITPWVPDFVNATNALIRCDLNSAVSVTPGTYWVAVWADETSGRRYGMRTTTVTNGFPNNGLSYVWDATSGFLVTPFNVAYRISE